MSEKYRHKVITKTSSKGDAINFLKTNPWRTSSIIIGLILTAVLFVNYFPTGAPQKVLDNAVSYINSNLLSQGATAELVSWEESNGLYVLNLNIGGQEYQSYVTKDGSLLFPTGIELSAEQALPTDANTQPVQSADSSRLAVSVDDDPSIGPADAPVTIVEFSDFECSFCERAEPTVKQVLEEYGDNVRFVYRDFPLSFHANSENAALASECADEQGKYWEYHDVLFDNQEGLSASDLKSYAQDLGLNTEQFNTCLDSKKYLDEVNADADDAQSLGVSGTPTFFINGVKLVGAQPLSAFENIIDSELGR